MPKPGDLYVGVVELFAVLLPGGFLLAAIVLAVPADKAAVLAPLLETSAAQWVAFLVTAYTLGTFVFLAASRIDDLLYDRYRRVRWPIAKDHAYRTATALRRRFFETELKTRGLDTAGVLDGDVPLNTFNWSKALLMLQAPAAHGDVLRYEAESKFFRSLVIVLPVMGFLALVEGLVLGPPVGLALGVLSFLRYADRRHQSTEWAYRYAIAQQLAPAPPAPAPST